MEIGGLTDFGKENLAGQIKGRRQGYGIFHDYNYFSGHGTAVNFLIFGKTITRNFYNGVSIRYYDMPETQ